MPGPVVVPLDGSTFAEIALPLGRLLARLSGAELHLVHVLTPPPPGPFHLEEHVTLEEHVRTRSLQYLDGLTDADGPDERPAVRAALLDAEEGVAAAIARYAREEGASWIVLTTHGGGGLSRWLTGSVADELVQSARTPLLFLRPWDVTGDLAAGEPRFRRILVPLDGSEEAESALEPAATLARAFGASVDLVQVVPPRGGGGLLHEIPPVPRSSAVQDEATDYLRARAEELRGEDLTVEAWLAAHESPADGILTAVAERGADLVVMTTHGRSGLQRLVLGSVADHVLRKGADSLALVRPPEVSPR